jgi:hypothetical protein
MGATGLERPSKNAGKIRILDKGGAEYGAVDAKQPVCDADLQTVVEAWPRLSDAVKARIVAIVQGEGD